MKWGKLYQLCQGGFVDLSVTLNPMYGADGHQGYYQGWDNNTNNCWL